MSFLTYIEKSFSFKNFNDFHSKYFINKVYENIQSFSGLPFGDSQLTTNAPETLYVSLGETHSVDFKTKQKVVFEFLRENFLSRIKKSKFKFSPFFYNEIVDYKGKKRVLHLLSFEEKFVDRIIHNYIQEKLVTKENKGVHSISKAIQKFTRQENTTNFNQNNKLILRIDIKDYFNTINKSILLDDVKKTKDENLFYLIKNFLMTVSYKNNELLGEKTPIANCIVYNPTTGIPTGSAISQALANFYLKELDDKMTSFLTESNGFYERYVDDICIICNNEETLNSSFEKIKLFFRAKHLSFSPHKFYRGRVEKGFEFLGFYHYNSKIYISHNTIKNIKLQIIKSFNSLQLEKKGHRFHLIDLLDKINRLNLGVVGFRNSWKEIAKELFNKSDLLLSNSQAINNLESSYGLARYLSISDDIKNIESFDKWIGRFLRYHLIKNGFNGKISNNYFKIESLKNWYYKFKKNENRSNQKAFFYYFNFYKKYNNRFKNLNHSKKTQQKREQRNWKLSYQITVFLNETLIKSYKELYHSENDSTFKNFDEYIDSIDFNELNVLIQLVHRQPFNKFDDDESYDDRENEAYEDLVDLDRPPYGVSMDVLEYNGL